MISDLTPPTLELILINLIGKISRKDSLWKWSLMLCQIVFIRSGCACRSRIGYPINTTVVYWLVELDTFETGWDDLPMGSAGVDVIGGRAENAVLVPVEALKGYRMVNLRSL